MNTAIVIASSTDANIQNASDCLKWTGQWAQTIYKNVCTGASYSVPNGFWDYFLNITFSVLLVAVAIFAIVRIIRLLND